MEIEILKGQIHDLKMEVEALKGLIYCSKSDITMLQDNMIKLFETQNMIISALDNLNDYLK